MAVKQHKGPTVHLPALHPGQLAITENAIRWNHVCMGRRFGKTFLLTRLAMDAALRGQYVGIFCPQYKFLTEIYQELMDRLRPLKPQASKTEGVMRLPTGGRIDYWSLENEACGRGRKYHLVLMDEAAFGKNDILEATWERAIMPTLVDYKGTCFMFSTPNGISDDNFFYKASQDPMWRKFQAPSSTNPYLPADELERIKETTHPLVYRQEFEAEFISWSGEVFFSLDRLLEDGKPVSDDAKIHGNVFAVIDTAMKTGTDNDATAVVFCGRQPEYMYEDRKPRLVILDWHIEQVEGGSLLAFVPFIQNRLEELCTQTKATFGTGKGSGIFIEDKQSGTVLLQQLYQSGLSVFPIDSKLTQMGKDERALAASPYIASNLVKLSANAYEKTMKLKGNTRNHLLSQLAAFRIGDKDASKRADDLIDCFTYSTILGVGHNTGF